jgi:hypothetical protein
MEWPPRTGPLGPDPYPNPNASFSPQEHEGYESYPPPANPLWALRSQSSAYPNEHGEVPVYPPPPSNPFTLPRSEHYPPQLSQANFPPAESSLESYNDAWIYDRSGFGEPTPPFYPYLHSTDSYPPSSFSDSFSSNFGSPHASVPPSAPPSDVPPAYHSSNGWNVPSAPNFPGGAPGLSFGSKVPSAHPLLLSVEDDFVPYGEEDKNDGGEEVKPGYGEDVDYSHEALEKYGVNLTTVAKEGSLDPVIGRDLVVRQCIEILTRKTKCNPVLVGHPGVGKTAVVEG